eukprot:510713_1
MADIHRNIALQTIFYRKWRDLFQMIVDHRHHKIQKKIKKYQIKLPPKRTKVRKKPRKSNPYYIVPESLILETQKQRKKKSKKKPKKRNKMKTNRKCHSVPTLKPTSGQFTATPSIQSNPVHRIKPTGSVDAM